MLQTFLRNGMQSKLGLFRCEPELFDLADPRMMHDPHDPHDDRSWSLSRKTEPIHFSKNPAVMS